MPVELRKVKSGKAKVEGFDVKQVGDEPVKWLIEQAKPGMLLLAHADDGVIWGRVEIAKDGRSTFVYPPDTLWQQAELRNRTLNMARIFNHEQELFLWRVAEDAWRARLIQDGEGETTEQLDEIQILWGDQDEDSENNFVLLTEGAQGLRHAPPIDLVDTTLHRKARLTVRHYLKDDDGWLRIAFSRLVNGQTEEAKQ